MKNFLLVLLFISSVISCKKDDDAEMLLLHKKLDSIAKQLETLKREKAAVKTDSVVEKEVTKITEKSKVVVKRDSITKKETIKPKIITKETKDILKKETPKSNIVAGNDTIFYYYKNY